jgi:glycosyltransferase involved in cell wall biosynthesis
MLKIGVDGRLLQGNLTGVGKYILNLINYLCDHNEEIYFNVYSNKELSCQFSTDRVKMILDSKLMSKIKPMVWSKLFAFRLINKDALDWFLAGDSFVPLFIRNVKIISVVHDLNAVLVPETLGKLKLVSMRLFLEKDLDKADVIVSNSEGTAEKLKKYYHKETNIIVHPLIDRWYKKIDQSVVKNKLKELSINYPYLLTVATHEPRKNLEKTIRAFIGLKKKGLLKDHKLVLVGSKGWKSEKLEFLMKIYSNDIIKMGYIPDDMMPYLYNGAELFVFPSSYEGFGMPVREALLCGIPVVTTDIPELREASYNSSIYINPEHIDQFQEAIMSSLNRNNETDNNLADNSNTDNADLDKLMAVLSN